MIIQTNDTEVRPISLGGTGATNKAQALTNLGVADYIVEQGTTNGWTWEKWNSGKYVCRKKGSGSVAYSSTLMGGYYASDYWTFPITFSEIPQVWLTGCNSNSAAFVTGRPTVSKIDISLLCPFNGTRTYAVDILVIGKWK